MLQFPFELDGGRLPSFTTRPDTVFGVTFLVVLAPDYPAGRPVAATGQEAAVAAFAEQARREAEADR